jgi:hypothetical protein
MNLEEFKSTLSQKQPPAGLGELLRALWIEVRGDWGAAHLIAQENSSTDGSWVHAYLHRKEGDLSNASYWYSRAGKKRPDISLEEEWEIIATTLLAKYESNP